MFNKNKKKSLLFILMFIGGVVLFKQEQVSHLTPSNRKGNQIQSLQSGTKSFKNFPRQKRVISSSKKSLMLKQTIEETNKDISEYPYEKIGKIRLYRSLYVGNTKQVQGSNVIKKLRNGLVLTTSSEGTIPEIYIGQRGKDILLISRSIILEKIGYLKITEILNKYPSLNIETSFNHLNYYQLGCSLEIEDCLKIVNDISLGLITGVASINIMKPKPTRQ